MATHASRLREGLPYPRGATWDGKGVNFALFSANATKVEVCLFDSDGKREIERIADFLFAKVIKQGALDRAKCTAFWGSEVEACREFK